MKRIIVCLIGLVLLQPFAYANTNDIVNQTENDYNNMGYKVPSVSVIYVDNFSQSNILASYNEGTIYIKKNADDVRAIRHEMAHAISLDLIKKYPKEFEKYKWNRIGIYRPQNEFYNVSCDELNLLFQWYNYYWYTLDTRELVAEDLYYMTYHLPTMQKDTIGEPNNSQQRWLDSLMKK
jgi:hypothetical protein